MQPKPTREWVILELERLGVRVVTGGRAGRTAGDGKGEREEEGPGMFFCKSSED